MTNYPDDNYHIWKIKLQLAQQGSNQAIQQIKSYSLTNNNQFPFLQNNFYQAIKNSNIKYFNKDQLYGNYQLYSDMPIFFVLEGSVQLKCVNLDGDDEVIDSYGDRSVIYLKKQRIEQKFGQSNVNIVTKYQLSCTDRSILIQIPLQSIKKLLTPQLTSLVTMRQQLLMKKYMIFPLKYIRIQTTLSTSLYQQKLYLLQGNACYYYHNPTTKQRFLLTVYQQGYFNPKQFQNTQIKLFIMDGAKIMIFQEEFIVDQAVMATEIKREQHLNQLVQRYKQMNREDRRKLQIKLINTYKLNKQLVEKQILGLAEPTQPLSATQKTQSGKRIFTKNDLISTSSSIKERCKIRISKKVTKKVT